MAGLKREVRMTCGNTCVPASTAFPCERTTEPALRDRAHEPPPLHGTPDLPLPSSRVRKPNLFLDCNSFGARAIELGVDLYGTDKIMFATDGADFSTQWSLKALQEARIDASAKSNILYDSRARDRRFDQARFGARAASRVSSGGAAPAARHVYSINGIIIVLLCPTDRHHNGQMF